MAIYLFDIYSVKGIERVKAETFYKPLWQVMRELKENYKKLNKIKSSVIIVLSEVLK